MAQFIYKHRRGTTEKWLASTIVPYDGELIVEERVDGTYEIKVGDGVHTFNDLPYLNHPLIANTEAELTACLIDENVGKTVTYNDNLYLIVEGTDGVTTKEVSFDAQVRADLEELATIVDGKVDKVNGKGLSTNDYTTTEKTKLAGIAENANNYSLPAAGSSLGGVKSGGDVTITNGTITVNDDSHAHTIANVDGLQSALDGKAPTHSHPYDASGSAANALKDAKSYTDTALEDYQTKTITESVLPALIYIEDTDPREFKSTTVEGTIDNIELFAGQVKDSLALSGALIQELAQQNTTQDTAISTAQSKADSAYSLAETKVDKVDGKGLSTNDYTTAEKDKLAGIATGANNYTLPAAGSSLGGVKSGGDVTISDGTITVNDDSHNHTIANVDNLQSSLDAKVPTSRTVNGKALSANITLSAVDVGADASGAAADALASAKSYADTAIANLVDSAPEALNTLGELATALTEHEDAYDALLETVGGKANASHNHSASNITSGTLPIARGGTGATTAAGILTNAGLTATAAEINKLDGVTATTAEINYLDGVTSNIQTQLNSKQAAGSYAAASHTHNYAGSSSAGGAATSANKVNAALTVQFNGTENAKFDGSAAKTVNITPSAIGAAASSHGTHVSYSTTAPVMDGTASVGTASTVARSDHKHPTDTSRASQADLTSHTGNTTSHITSTERTNWNAAKTHADSAHAPSNAEKNQNAFSKVAVSGQNTVEADTTTDTLTLVAGSNVTLTTDSTNDKITIAAKDTTYSAATTSAAGLMSAADKTKLDGLATDTNVVHKTGDETIAGLKTFNGGIQVVNTDISAAASGTNINALFVNDDSITLTAQVKDEPTNGFIAVSKDEVHIGGGSTNTTIFDEGAGTIEIKGIKIPTTSGGSTWGLGSNGQVIKSNGSSVYWGTLSYNDLTNKPSIPSAYTLPAAGSALGGVKTGGDVTISNGTITVNDDSHNHVISNVDGLQTALDGKFDKLTYEWNKSLNFSSTGKLYVGRFRMYDSNLTIEFSCTTSDTYSGKIVLATQNGLVKKFSVYGDASNSLTPRIYIKGEGIDSSNYQWFQLYFNPPAWSKNICHVMAQSIIACDESVLMTSVDAIPSDATTQPTNQLTSNFLGKTAKASSASTADSATKATQDGAGNVIADTYVKLNTSSQTISGITEIEDLTITSNFGVNSGASFAGDVSFGKTPTINGKNVATTTNATASAAGLIKVSSVNSSAVTVNSESTTAGRYYPVELNSDGKAIVNVPWTDNNTTYSNFVKSGSGAKAGLVPAPSTTAGTTKYLREDGTWQVPPDNNTVYTHPTTAGNKHIPSGGSSGQILRWSAAGTAVWGADNNTTYSAGTGISLSGTTFSVNQAFAPTWTGHHIFNSGLTVNEGTIDLLSNGQPINIDAGDDQINISTTDEMFLYAHKLYFNDDPVATNSDVTTASKKTASGDTSSKIFLVGTTSQSSDAQTTYSHNTAYVGTDGCLYSNNTKVATTSDVAAGKITSITITKVS